ncbi:MAG: DUF1574 domain-containing protein [bacterium]|nr:DUF1574 domain-containing protein [bacterium]
MKWLREHLYLYYPVAVFALYFGVEKVFALDSVKILSQSDATYLFFQYKEELLDEMAEVHRRNAAGEPAPVESEQSADAQAAVADSSDPMAGILAALQPGMVGGDPGGDIDPGEEGFPEDVRAKTMMVLGSSRLLYFDYSRFDRNFPDWEMFNFSAPVTAPAYYLYILERALDRGVKPDYLVLETDPFQFNSGSDAFRRSNLGFSFDFPFIFKYFSHFRRTDVSYFFARNLFAGYRYPPDPENIRTRLRNSSHPMLLAVPTLDAYQRANRGAGKNVIPRDSWFERDFATLELSSERTLGWLYGNYDLSDRQFYFFEEILKRAKAEGIPVTLVRPQVSRPMTRMLNTLPRYAEKIAEWERRAEAIMQRYDATYLDLSASEDYYCNSFVDGSHMAMDCYHPMLVLVMRQYENLAADQHLESASQSK